MDEKQLYEFKPRKAKFGFKGSVYSSNIIALGEITKQVQMRDADSFLELNFNMGANEYKLYTNNPNIAEFIREQYCEPA